jgi:4-amino-4-deoxy-L-arabinose transferase-like glycosyltransferase
LCTFTSEGNALFATTILSFDAIFFVHSSLFLRDVPLMFFGLFSFYLYLKKHYYLCGLVLGFSFFIKETGVFYLILLSIYHIGITKPRKINLKNLKMIGIFLTITAGTFLLPLWIYDIIYQPIIYDPMFPTEKTLDGRDVGLGYPKTKVIESRGIVLQNATGIVTNPIEHLGIYLSDGYLTSEVFKIENWKNTIHTNYPWGWIVPLPPPEKGNNLGWVSGITIDETYDGILHKGEILGIRWMGHANLSLWVVGFWSTLGLIIFSAIKKRTHTSLFLAAGLVSMYLPYVLLSMTGRVLYSYYFILTIPFVALGIVLTLDMIKQEKIRYVSKFVLLAAVVGWFVWFFPLQIIS